MENYTIREFQMSGDFEGLCEALLPALWELSAKFFPEAVDDGYAVVVTEFWKLFQNKKLMGWNLLERLKVELKRARSRYWSQILDRREHEQKAGDGEDYIFVDAGDVADADAPQLEALEAPQRDLLLEETDVRFHFGGSNEEEELLLFLHDFGFDIGNGTRIGNGSSGDTLIRTMLVDLPQRQVYSRRKTLTADVIFTAAVAQLHAALFWSMFGKVLPMQPWARGALAIFTEGLLGLSEVVRPRSRTPRRLHPTTPHPVATPGGLAA